MSAWFLDSKPSTCLQCCVSLSDDSLIMWLLGTLLYIHNNCSRLICSRFLNGKTSNLVKPGAHGCGPRKPGFLKSFRPQTLVYVCVCVHPPRPLITSHMKGMRNNRIRQFYGSSISLYIQLLLLINWMDMALVTLPIVNACWRKLKTGTNYSRTTRWRQVVRAF